MSERRRQARQARAWQRSWRPAVLGLLTVLSTSSGTVAASPETRYDDPLFRRCLNWMLDGTGGALIDNLCLEYYSLPPPSLFLCARKVTTGFASSSDQEGCAILFEEQAKKVRAGYVK